MQGARHLAVGARGALVVDVAVPLFEPGFQVGVRYYVGERYIGHEATLHVDRDEVQIWARGERIATHPREPVDGKRSVLPFQREELISKPGARPYLKRDLLLELCPAAHWCLTEIRHRRPKRWEEEVAKLYELLGEFEEAALRDAFIEAGRRGLAGAEYVEAILRGQTAAREGLLEKALEPFVSPDGSSSTSWAI
jgi:hypothetical protein